LSNSKVTRPYTNEKEVNHGYYSTNIVIFLDELYKTVSVNSVDNVSSYLTGFTMGMKWTQNEWVYNRFSRPAGGYGAEGTVYGLYTFNLIVKDISLSGSEDLHYGFVLN